MKRAAAAASLAGLSLVTACGGGGGTGGATGGDTTSIVVALAEEPGTLDAAISKEAITRAVYANIYEPLTTLTPDGGVQPLLIKALPTAVDENTWQADIVPGVKFQDGSALTAQIAADNINRIVDPETGSEFSNLFATIEGASAVDDDTVEIKTKVPDPNLLAKRLSYIMIQGPSNQTTFTQDTKPVGTGPYEFVEWKRGQSISLKSFDGYRGDKPKITSATFRFVPDGGARVAGIKSGEFDAVFPVSVEEAKSLPQTIPSKGTDTLMIEPNISKAPFDDVRVRKAALLAVDLQAVAKNLFADQVTIAAQLVSPVSTGFNKDLKPLGYDPAEAKRLIAEAGATGAEVSLMTNEAYGSNGGREWSEAIASYWEAAGLKVQVNPVAFDVYVDSLRGKKDRPGAIVIKSSDEFTDASGPVGKYLISESDRTTGGDADTDSKAAAALATTDRAARQEAYAALMASSMETLYSLPMLYVPAATLGVGDGVTGALDVNAAIILADMSVG